MAEAAENENQKTGSMLGRLAIALFMGGVVGAECLFAYFWLPSEDEVTARAEQIVEEAKAAASKEEDTTDEEIVLVEVDLGRFTITNHRLPTEATFRTEFHLVGTVAKDDEDEFVKLLERNKHRFRDQIIVEVRNSEISDLEDAGLGLIKRRFLEKSNALFGKPLLRSMFFADYTFLEL